MRPSSLLVTASAIGLIFSGAAAAQPRPYGDAWRAPSQGDGRHDDRGGQIGRDGRMRPGDQGHDARGGDQRYFYNGRWVDQNEWSRHSSERDRWTRNYQRRAPERYRSNSDTLVAGIIGFALGAAIVGSQQDAERARTADASFDQSCARRYRSYDRSSRTYMGLDGLRHFCR